jgi:hypothetical protein
MRQRNLMLSKLLHEYDTILESKLKKLKITPSKYQLPLP